MHTIESHTFYQELKELILSLEHPLAGRILDLQSQIDGLTESVEELTTRIKNLRNEG